MVGSGVGTAVGPAVGTAVGLAVGALVGTDVGDCTGASVGAVVGSVSGVFFGFLGTVTVTLQDNVIVFFPFFTLQVIVDVPFFNAFRVHFVFVFLEMETIFFLLVFHVAVYFVARFNFKTAVLPRVMLSFLADNAGFFDAAVACAGTVAIMAKSEAKRS